MKQFRVAIFLAASYLAAQSPRMPMAALEENSAEAGWRAKKVLAVRSLDMDGWAFRGTGNATYEALDGSRWRVRLDVDLQTVKPTGWSGAPAAALTRQFGGEDWSRFNRIAFRARARMTGFHTCTLAVSFSNIGREKVPDAYGREGAHYVTLNNGEWRDVHWEIPNLGRDRVASLGLRYFAPKTMPAPEDRVSIEIEGIRLERVTPDAFEGWGVPGGRIAYSHTGYAAQARKSALAQRLNSKRFSVLDAKTGAVALSKPIRNVKSRLGEFAEMDFTELEKPGLYVLRSGNLATRPFAIGADVWNETIWKTINFFYGERCGMAIPGIHDECHRDWQAVHGDRKIVMNGGWHDAGDLSQGAVNTSEAAYAMFALAASLKARGAEPALITRLIEEGKWGLEWLLKVRFEGGHRIGFASINIWTNGVIGDSDDRTAVALDNPNVNYLAASAEAIAYRVLKDSEPGLAARALRAAEEDWQFAIAGREIPETRSTPAFAATELELAAVGALASLELYQATGKPRYAEKAHELASVVVESQQRTYVGREFKLAGFFYTNPAKTDILHQFHRGNDQAPVVALARMCEMFPKDKEWMKWYAAVALYGEYQKKAALATTPYRVLPAYVYRDDEYMRAVDNDRYQSSRQAYREQVLNGMPMGGGYYLKAFPVWFNRRGNYGVLLSQAKGLAAASRLRGDGAGADLVQRQLEWVVGRNPFSQSTMWGEGYDFSQQYSVSSGDIVGSLPVGMMTRGNADAPYWPGQNGFVYKEVWVHPSARWLWILEDGPASRHLPKDPELRVATSRASDGSVLIRARLRGAGRRSVELLSYGLTVARPVREVELRRGVEAVVTWTCKPAADKPWVAVVVPDGDFEHRQEAPAVSAGNR